MSNSVENTDWDFVLQFASEPLDLEMPAPEKPVSGRVEPPTGAAVAQVPTPPKSFTASPVYSPPDENALVSVSTTFFPGAQNHALPPDLVLLSSDSVFFYVHIHVLLAASDNDFNSLLPSSPKPKSGPMGPVVLVSEPSTVLNIVLHAVYDMSCSHYSPSFESFATALNAMTTYGISLGIHVAPTTSLYTVLLSLAPIYPLELYALAASYDLYDLAVPTSAYLLSFSLASLTDEMAERIGPKYLKRLFFLHFGRADALKRLLLPPPHPHPPTSTCDYSEQKKLTRAWALASAYLAWDARPDLSTSTMESALAPLGDQLSCESCRRVLQERLKILIMQWSVVKNYLAAQVEIYLLAAKIIDSWLYPPVSQEEYHALYVWDQILSSKPSDWKFRFSPSVFFTFVLPCAVFFTVYPPTRHTRVLNTRISHLPFPTLPTPNAHAVHTHASDVDGYDAYEFHL